MDYRIALPPEIGVSADDFAHAWNETPEARRAASARVHRETMRSLDPVATALVVLGSVAVNLASSVIYDLVKAALARRGVRRRVEIREVPQPDGTRLLVVTTEEEG